MKKTMPNFRPYRYSVIRQLELELKSTNPLLILNISRSRNERIAGFLRTLKGYSAIYSLILIVIGILAMILPLAIAQDQLPATPAQPAASINRITQAAVSYTHLTLPTKRIV